MLTDRTVELITEFEGWEYPNNHQHKSDRGVTTFDHWGGVGINHYYEDKVLNKDEQQRLEKLLIQKPRSEIYEVVSNFIKWSLRNFPFEGYDYKEHIIFNEEYEYYYLGRRKSSIDGTSLEDECHFNPTNRLYFWDKHYRIEYFEKTLPHYVESLRRLLE